MTIKVLNTFSVGHQTGLTRRAGHIPPEQSAPGALTVAAYPFFIVAGCPRSGTTLLASLLQRHFGIAMPIETHFIPLFGRWAWLWGDLRNEQNRRRLLNDIFRFLDIWIPEAMKERDLARTLPYSLHAARPDSQSIAASAQDYPSLVAELFAAYARRHGLERWGDKSALTEARLQVRTFDNLPQARVIHIVRDGRDVAASWLRIWSGPRSVAAAADFWATHIRRIRHWGQAHPRRYLELRYEDLAQNPETMLARLRDWLELPLQKDGANAVGAAFAAALTNDRSHPRLAEKVGPESVGAWQTRLTAGDVAVFEQVAGAELRAAGYALAGGDRKIPVSRRLDNWPLLARLYERLRLHTMRRNAKNLLPVALRFTPGALGRRGFDAS